MKSRKALIPDITDWREKMPSAIIDKIDVSIGDWAIIGQAHDVRHFLASIQDIDVITKDGEAIPAFNQPKIGNDATTFFCEVSRGPSGNVTYPTIPVFGGNLAHVFGEQRLPAQYRHERVRIGFAGKLNLLRFLAAQRYTNRGVPNRAIRIQEFSTALEQGYLHHGQEYCLTADSNVLLGPPSLYRYARSKRAEEHLVDYITALNSHFDREFARIASDFGVRVQRVPYYSIQYVEFVWEFDHANPLRFVERSEIPMRALGETSRKGRALVRGEDVCTLQDSFVVKTEICAGSRLALYAKTNRRVRFEMRLNDYRVGRVLESRGVAGRTCDSIVELRTMVRHLRNYATTEFTDAMDELDVRSIGSSSNRTHIDLCVEVTDVLQNKIMSKIVLDTLRHRQSLASPQGSPMKKSAEKLCKAGILRRRKPRHPVYVPQDQWVSAVEGLRQM